MGVGVYFNVKWVIEEGFVAQEVCHGEPCIAGWTVFYSPPDPFLALDLRIAVLPVRVRA